MATHNVVCSTNTSKRFFTEWLGCGKSGEGGGGERLNILGGYSLSLVIETVAAKTSLRSRSRPLRHILILPHDNKKHMSLIINQIVK